MIPEGTFVEETAAQRIRSTPLSHLSLELGHLYMEDFAAGPAHLAEQFRRVAPWAAAARASVTAKSAPRVSTCFLIDDYFTRFGTPRGVVGQVVEAAAEAGLEIDYIARESGCATADGVELARLVESHLVGEPAEGFDGSRPPLSVTGWLTNGERSPSAEATAAMTAPQSWQPPRQSAARNHSIFVDIELWSEAKGDRLWSCPFLAAVWQVQRLGLVRFRGEAVAEPRFFAPGSLPDEWAAMPAVVQLHPRSAPFRAYRTVSVMDSRFLPIEVAVRTILGQFAVPAPLAELVAGRAAGEAVRLPRQVVDRVGYVFL